MTEGRMYTLGEVSGFEPARADGPDYRLDYFEGPLDLLLYLIARHKLDIYDIPIVTLVDQYLDYVRLAGEEDMDLAADFLAMAARLVLMKSAALLPSDKEIAEKLKRELTGELIDYRDCKTAASMLSRQTDGFDMMVRDQAEDVPSAPYSRVYPVERLLKAYKAAVGRQKDRLPPSVEDFRVIVASKIVSVASKFPVVIKILSKPGRHSLRSLFETGESRSDLVAVFLSVLELVKNKNVRVDGELGNEQITLLNESTEGLIYEE